MEHTSFPPWQQALNPKLVRRLWRQVERPGLIWIQRSQAMLARHQRLAAGTSLAERLQRRAQVELDGPVALLPIVYAQPQPAPEVHVTLLNQPGLTRSDTRPMPIVSTLPVAHESASLNQGDMAQSSAAAPNMGSSQSAVIQRSAAPVASVPAIQLVSPLLPLDHDTPSRVTSPLPYTTEPFLPRAPRTDDSTSRVVPPQPVPLNSSTAPHDVSRDDRHPARSIEPLPVITAWPVSDALSRVDSLLLVQPLANFIAGQTSARIFAPDDLSALPIVRAQANGSGNPVDELPIRSAAPQITRGDTSAPLPVVRELLIRERTLTTDLPMTQLPLSPSPLSGAVAATQVATGQPVGRTSLSSAESSSTQTSRLATSDPVVNTRAKQPATPNAADVERIVNKVHRKFIRQLTVEGERRGLR